MDGVKRCWGVAIVAVVVAACSYDPQLPPGLLVTCGPNGDCPSGQRCMPHPRNSGVRVCCPPTGCVAVAVSGSPPPGASEVGSPPAPGDGAQDAPVAGDPERGGGAEAGAGAGSGG